MVLQQSPPNMIRQLVSGNKRRFQEDGFDLDLSYISDRIIAMGFPAQKLEGVYRNHIDDVFRFLEQKHRDRYKLYNLCSERHYPADKFHGRVAHFPFDDHNPPKIEDMDRFCDDVADWLRQDEQNVVAIHCKAGKGRTGVMICAFLMYAQMVPNAAAALLMYGSKRTSDAKGVTIPSQRRYVEYYEKLVTRQIQYMPVTLVPDSISFSPLPNLNGGNYTFFFVMYGQEKREIWRSEAKKAGRNCFEYVFPNVISLTGDVKIEFKHRDALNVRKQSLFSFWFNTFFALNPLSDQSCLSSAGLPQSPGPDSGSCCPSHLRPVNGNGTIPQSESGTRGDLCQKGDRHNHKHGDAGVTLVLLRDQLDRVHKVKHSKVFPSDFRVELRFKPLSETDVAHHHHRDLQAAASVPPEPSGRCASPPLPGAASRNGICPPALSGGYSDYESSSDEED